MMRKAGTTASTPMCGRMPHSGARITPANAASMVPSTNTHTRSRVEVDAERLHDLAVVRAGLDHGAEARALDDHPDARHGGRSPAPAAQKR